MTVAWYVHHHGRGHLHRCLAVVPRLSDVTVLSSLAQPPACDTGWVRLPLDLPLRDEQAATVAAGGALHWAPLGRGGYRDRMTAIAATLQATQPDALVVDVSVEVALLGRLLGIPVVWVAQRGVRDDEPHRLAYTVASQVIAPWTAATGDGADDAACASLTHVGALSRFDGRAPRPLPSENRVLLLMGFGGHELAAAEIQRAAAATADWQWDVTGVDDLPGGANLTVHGPECDIWGLLGAAAVVIASASGNAVAEVAAARRPLICLPQPRPFNEQHAQARALADAGLATTLTRWPETRAWPSLLERARRCDPREWSRLHDGHGADRFAEAITAMTCA